MKILVTGAGGFIGSHLVKRLTAAGHNVIAFARKDGNLCEVGALDSIESVEYVYHLAARTFVPDSWQETQAYLTENIASTVTVLEYCRRVGCGVSLMSTYVYGEPQYLPVDEAHPVCAVSPYHESKLLCESLGAFYARTFHVPVTVFRTFNLYGAGQNAAFLVPKIVGQLLNPQVSQLEVMDLTPKRDYVYIEDAVEILAKACERKAAGYEVYNIGSGTSVSVEEVIRTAMAATGISKPYHDVGQARQGEISDCVASMEKTRQAFGTQPPRNLKAGLCAWMKGV